MAEDMNCPKAEKCPIFIGGVLKRAESERIYRSLYCTAGIENYSKCMRLRVSEETGKPVPITVLPNSTKPIKEIIASLKSV